MRKALKTCVCWNYYLSVGLEKRKPTDIKNKAVPGRNSYYCILRYDNYKVADKSNEI